MSIYELLSKIKVARRNYPLKFFLVALPAMLLPLFVLCLFIVSGDEVSLHLYEAGIAAVLLSGVLIIASFFLFRKLAKPLTDTRDAVSKYAAFKTLPVLPAGYEDEAGLLMAEVQRALEEIDAQLTEKSDMIDLLSHDMRSPVTRIMGLSNVIKLDDDPETVQYADMISTECRNLLTLMENILLMFRENTQIFAPQNVNLLNLANESVHFFDILSKQKNLTFKVDIDEHLLVNVQQGLFTQALRNILGNAIKFSSEGKSIFISAKQYGQEIAITIRDEGVGMNQKELVQIFERFTNAGKKGTHGETSIGLGLYLSRKIIEKQGGHITAESDGQGKGAIFTIRLYQLVTKKKSEPMPLPLPVPGAPDADAPKKKTVKERFFSKRSRPGV